MSFFTPTAPVNEEERDWIENGMTRLTQLFGFERLRTGPTILPKPEFFPDRYTPNENGLEQVSRKLCEYMDVEFNSLDLYLYSESSDVHRARLAVWESSHSGAAGRYRAQENGRFLIGVEMKLLKQPIKLVATIAHELGHVLLLGSGKVDSGEEDHEYLTDLLTVYLGMGLFTANAAFQFTQWQDGQRYGWGSARQGYLSEPMFGYALAAYCWMRGEMKPAWERLLATNVRNVFNRSRKYLTKTGKTVLPRG